jgi:hypothetical protein
MPVLDQPLRRPDSLHHAPGGRAESAECDFLHNEHFLILCTFVNAAVAQRRRHSVLRRDISVRCRLAERVQIHIPLS